jgi:hypothetical protein
MCNPQPAVGHKQRGQSTSNSSFERRGAKRVEELGLSNRAAGMAKPGSDGEQQV